MGFGGGSIVQTIECVEWCNTDIPPSRSRGPACTPAGFEVVPGLLVDGFLNRNLPFATATVMSALPEGPAKIGVRTIPRLANLARPSFSTNNRLPLTLSVAHVCPFQSSSVDYAQGAL